MRRRSRLLGLLLPLALLTACAGPTHTIRELGQPAFEPLLGALRLERVEEPQTKGFDAWDPERVEDDGDHRLALRFWPLGDEALIAIEVRARGLGRLSLSEVAAAIYPATLSEANAFELQGTLPASEPLTYSQESERDGESLVLVLRLPRAQLPVGCEALAVPVLSRFRDGWVHVQFYKTAIPEPLRRETLEEAQRRAQGAALASEAPPSEAAPPPQEAKPQSEDAAPPSDADRAPESAPESAPRDLSEPRDPPGQGSQ